ncbi:D-amino-acid dehydrogenase [Gelidibacter algens]|uniref:D-amino-acid dehydrogenase n=1 Tax=Gelidibacter algens TaxID=49280 RepID=A0A1A7QY96_9FLAO|nr:FAD-dependent oxidoreductase [Gelidibacter algens]OBX24980.1 amino acid dehydrogenase [Gelidibacter algens]RAJ19830.1 D-amino-acid dehydrogenase [Gelidibacter algens]
MSKKVIIIGGGIIGLCSAYYLQKDGHQVTVIDQSNMDAGASYVNAGYLSPSHIIPLSAPGVMIKGLKWMFNSASPLYIKPRMEADFLKWTYAFNKSCSSNHVKKAIPAIKDLAVLSQELYKDIREQEHFTSQYRKDGILMLCQTEKALKEALKTAGLASEEGLEVNEVTLADLKRLEPNVNLNVIGGTHYKCDAHTTPNEFMSEMKAYLKLKGVVFYANEKVEDIEVKNHKISALITKTHTFTADEFVLAAGSWSALLSKKLGIHLLLQAGKGYRINTTSSTGIKLPAILTESKVAVTPMNGFTRFGGTMEIAGINSKINKNRIDAIANAVTKYYPEITLTETEKEDAASGLRPVTPDGLAYIGKSSKCSNLIIATGHAMMGWSMGTGTGKLVSELISDKKLSLDIHVFSPDRRF